MKTHDQKLAELRMASAELSARRESVFAAIDEAIATHRAADPDHCLTHPLANQEAALIRENRALLPEVRRLRELASMRPPLLVTKELVIRCAQAIADIDRVTPRPLTAEDQARAVLEYLANKEIA